LVLKVEGDKKVRFSKKSNQVIIVMAYIPRLKEEYKSRVIAALKEEVRLQKCNASSKTWKNCFE
jgi:2-phospho-L-lactate guanylyltransferase (CobY/MobA/RfbA family)